MSDVILKIDGLSKMFRSHWTFRPIDAVRDISLEILRGESFGFLGHNGAGKTTTIKCILNFIKKSAGRIELDGRELISSERHGEIGYLPEQPYFYDHLTVLETLEFFTSLYEMKRSERATRVLETLELVGLADRKNSSVRALSKGLQQRLGLAQAIVHRPKLLLLDEPFSGLDPIGRLEFREIILGLNREGTTVLLSSHILSDVEDICDRVSIMVRGELKTVFHLADAPKLFGESFELIVTEVEGNGQLLDRLVRLSSKHEVEKTIAGAIHIFRFESYDIAHQALADATSARVKVENFRTSTLSLEDIFMSITGSRKPHVNGGSQLPATEQGMELR